MKPVILFIILFLFFINCGSPGPDIGSKKFQITVSILPQKYFVERIAGDGTNIDFDIHVMIPPGQIALMRIPFSAYSKAAALVKPMIPAFEAP